MKGGAQLEALAIRGGAFVDDWPARASFAEIVSTLPRTARAVCSRVGGVMRKKMVKAVRQNPVARASLTRALRDATPGGALSRLSAVKMTWLPKSVGFGFNVDWIEPLRPFASRFMDGGPVGLPNPRVRAALHRALYYCGRRGEPVDPGAVQPPREVVEPVRQWADADFGRQFRGALKTLFDEAARGKWPPAGKPRKRP